MRSTAAPNIALPRTATTSETGNGQANVISREADERTSHKKFAMGEIDDALRFVDQNQPRAIRA